MKLVIHSGLHKTATSSFQRLCDTNRALLSELNVHYPKYGDRIQHSHVMWDLQKSGIAALSDFLSKSIGEAGAGCHTVLISGEDFENCIVDGALASEVEAEARRAGFETIEWVVVTRSVGDYVSSIYSEKSKHGVVLRRDTLERAATERGCFYLASDKYNYIFVLDYARFAERFREHVAGEVTELSFSDFVQEFAGAILLRRLFTEDQFARFAAEATFEDRKKNVRLDARQVEAKYISNALGVQRFKSRRFRALIAPLIWLRGRTVTKAGTETSG